MKKLCFLIAVTLSLGLFADHPIDFIMEEWMKYHLSGGCIGLSSKVFDKTLRLVAKRKIERAKEYLSVAFPDEDLFIEETIKLFEDASKRDRKHPFRFINSMPACFSFTEYLIDKRNEDKDDLPYSPTEIRSHVVEAVVSALVCGECIALKSPMSALAAAIQAVHNFQEAAHKYCENIRCYEDCTNLYDRFNDSEVR